MVWVDKVLGGNQIGEIMCVTPKNQVVTIQELSTWRVNPCSSGGVDAPDHVSCDESHNAADVATDGLGI